MFNKLTFLKDAPDALPPNGVPKPQQLKQDPKSRYSLFTSCFFWKLIKKLRHLISRLMF